MHQLHITFKKFSRADTLPQIPSEREKQLKERGWRGRKWVKGGLGDRGMKVEG